MSKNKKIVLFIVFSLEALIGLIIEIFASEKGMGRIVFIFLAFVTLAVLLIKETKSTGVRIFYGALLLLAALVGLLILILL